MSELTVHGVVFLDEASGQYVAICLEYFIATQGDNEDHAFEMLREAVELHLEDAPPPEEDMEFQPVGSVPVIRGITVATPEQP